MNTLEDWLSRHAIHRFESSAGVENLNTVIRALGYQNLDYFLADNQGAMEAIIEWLSGIIDSGQVPEWREALELTDDVEESVSEGSTTKPIPPVKPGEAPSSEGGSKEETDDEAIKAGMKDDKETTDESVATFDRKDPKQLMRSFLDLV